MQSPQKLHHYNKIETVSIYFFISRFGDIIQRFNKNFIKYLDESRLRVFTFKVEYFKNSTIQLNKLENK